MVVSGEVRPGRLSPYPEASPKFIFYVKMRECIRRAIESRLMTPAGVRSAAEEESGWVNASTHLPIAGTGFAVRAVFPHPTQ